MLLVFFHESVSPQPQGIPLGPFQILLKIRGNIRKSRCTTGINDTGGKIAACINDTGGKFATDVNDTGGILPPISTTLAAMGTLSGCRYLKVNLKAKLYIYVNSTIQRYHNKIV